MCLQRFRSFLGEVHILDAYCPHLGANMALGGTVHGDCLECPFHKWRFAGPTGDCKNVPYSSGSTPNVKVKRWPVCEANGFIFVWYHAEGEEPCWTITDCPEIEKEGFPFHGRTDTLVACHIQVNILLLDTSIIEVGEIVTVIIVQRCRRWNPFRFNWVLFNNLALQ